MKHYARCSQRKIKQFHMFVTQDSKHFRFKYIRYLLALEL